MSPVGAWRALKPWRRAADTPGADLRAPAIPWGRIGGYDAVSRNGILFLLAPGPAHPSRRVTSPA